MHYLNHNSVDSAFIQEVHEGDLAKIFSHTASFTGTVQNSTNEHVAVCVFTNVRPTETLSKLGDSVTISASANFHGAKIKVGDLVDVKFKNFKAKLLVDMIINNKFVLLQKPGKKPTLNIFEKIRFLLK